MKDVVLYVLFCLLYGVLALYWAPAAVEQGSEFLTWQALGSYLLLFAAVATLARWTVMAFKPRAPGLRFGQTIVGVEEQQADRVIDVVKPVALRREDTKPRLKRKKPL